jgi:Tfp pilus assembly protein PilV
MRRRRLPGVSLIEVLISVVILGFGLLASVQAMNAALLTTQHSNRVALATTLAEAAVEEMRGTGDYASGTEDLDVPLLVNGQRVITVENYDNNSLYLRKVTVLVSWTGRHGQTEHVQVQTVIGIRNRHAGG